MCKYLNYLCSLTANDTRYTYEIQSRIAMAKGVFYKKKNPFHKQIGFNLRKKLVKFCVWSKALYSAESRHFGSISEISGKF
jgi:hypothetical protein